MQMCSSSTSLGVLHDGSVFGVCVYKNTYININTYIYYVYIYIYKDNAGGGEGEVIWI